MGHRSVHGMIAAMAAGDHIRVLRRRLYWHHGIDLGDGSVIHASGEPGRRNIDAEVRHSSIEEFARGGEIEIVDDGGLLSGDEVVARARQALGTKDYSLLSNNCEHFARWCRTGRGNSEQIDAFAIAGTVLGLAARLAIAGIARKGGTSLAIRALPLAGPLATGLAVAAAAVAVGTRVLRAEEN